MWTGFCEIDEEFLMKMKNIKKCVSILALLIFQLGSAQGFEVLHQGALKIAFAVLYR